MFGIDEQPRLGKAILSLAALIGVTVLASCTVEVGAEAAKRIGRAADVAGFSATPQNANPVAGVQLAQATTGDPSQAIPISPFLRPAPDIFEATGLAIWDGKRTLQGIWVAHPLAASARRVRIFNQDNGQAVDGALFKRDSAGGGASVLISSEAAQLLGMQVGTPAELRIVAVSPIQRSTEPAKPAETVAVDETDKPVSNEVATTTPQPTEPQPTEPQQPEPSETETATLQPLTPVTPPAAKPTPAPAQPSATTPAKPEQETTPEAPRVTAVAPAAQSRPEPTTQTSPLRLPYIQAGIFGVEGNATKLIRRMKAADLPAFSREIRSRGKKLTKVLAGPFQSSAERQAALRKIRNMGLRDATPVRR